MSGCSDESSERALQVVLRRASYLAMAAIFGACSQPGGSSQAAAGAGNAGALGGSAPASNAPLGGNTSATEGGVAPVGGADDASGGMGGGGASAVPSARAFMLGADISSAQESDVSYRDVDGSEKALLDVLKNHRFNYVRLRTFVEPGAPYGYASSANGCEGLPEPFGDRDHVIAAGKQVKQAGMGLLLDLHYSDVWADPGKQIIPQAWRGATSIAELASLMQAYTSDVIAAAIDAGARPDMVQVGNEITPGLLLHVPGQDTDCWGNAPEPAAIGGSVENWDDLAVLLKAGIQGVRDVDPTIEIMLHIENTDDLDGVHWWVDSALSRGVSFDVLGLSCYVAYQGPPSVWQTTFSDLATHYPNLQFVIAEYNPERTQANLMIKNLPDGRGLGTFFWEPTRSGAWGSALFSFEGNTATANPQDFAELDQLASQLEL